MFDINITKVEANGMRLAGSSTSTSCSIYPNQIDGERLIRSVSVATRRQIHSSLQHAFPFTDTDMAGP